MNKNEVQQRINKLRETINYHRYLYHVLDKQEISDSALDSLKKELFDLEQEFPDLVTKDSPTQRVGGEPLKEFKKEFGIFMSEDVKYNEEAVEKFLKKDRVSDILSITRERFEKIDPFTQENIEKEARALIDELKIESADLIHPLRVAVTGKAVSAGVFEVLALLGKDRVVKRLERVLTRT